ncbi:MAG TPA: RDD family protein, partial [Microlunatus sp.]|nr:RDD family protein [Microlunatus sp.]
MPEQTSSYPGERLGLPAGGRGSLASWRARVAALILDWAASMAVAVGLFGSAVVTGTGWQAWMVLAVFLVESTLLVTVASGSFGQLICRIAVVRLDTKPVGFPRALLRQALI